MASLRSCSILFTEIIIIFVLIEATCSLRCRSDDGPSDAELKRVVRSCMRKFGDAVYAQNSQQQQQIQQQGRQRSRFGNREYFGYAGGYDDSDDMDDEDNDDDQQHYNYNNNNRNYNRQQNGYNNNNNNMNNNNDNERSRNGGGRSHSSYDSYGSRYGGSNNRTNYGNGNGNNNNNNYSYNQRNFPNNRNNANNYNSNNSNNNNKSNRSKNNNNNNNNNNQNNSSSNDAACITHCFFSEMHMLNNNNYPDRHKVIYILTKDIRDRELRNFYTDTIQECFQYLETQRRRDKCQFSRDLINCMTEYAKGNCDDWNEFNMMFN